MNRPRPLMKAIVQLRLEWNRLADVAYCEEIEGQLDRIYRYAWEALEDMYGYDMTAQGGGCGISYLSNAVGLGLDRD